MQIDEILTKLNKSPDNWYNELGYFGFMKGSRTKCRACLLAILTTEISNQSLT